MEWLLAVIAVAVLGLAAVAAAGGLGQLGPVRVDRPPLILPESDMTAEDLEGLRFLVVPRGYAMEQVDEVLARLQNQLRAASNCLVGPGSGIIDSTELGDRRNHDGSDETSHG
ncbi:MAG: DivIVA domain-containing protein [Propionibacteriaceae bacterium]|nr:DivIVA domain-containing protein [Propionibacteriaceae bacterium]